MKKQLSLMGAFVLLSTLASPTFAVHGKGNVFCAEPGSRLSFEVEFDADYENAVVIYQIVNNRPQAVMSFNNYFGKGAGQEWMSGAGSWVAVGRGGECYRIKGQHKNGTANPSLPWVISRSQRMDEDLLGFEDGGDQDFNDVTVTVSDF